MMDIIQFGSFWNILDLKSLRLLNLLDAAAHDCLSRAHIHTIPGWTTNLQPAQEDLGVECQALETFQKEGWMMRMENCWHVEDC